MKQIAENKLAKSTLVAVVLFLFFDLSALGLNVWLSWHIEQQAVAINLAGRQRMLSQRMVKNLLQLEKAVAERKPVAGIRNELTRTYQLFDSTLSSFRLGGQTEDTNGVEIYLPPARELPLRQVLNDSWELWQPYRTLVEQVVHSRTADLPVVLPEAIDIAESRNPVLLEQMNQLTYQLEVKTQKEAARIRYFQGLAFALALVNFFGVFYFSRRRLSEVQQQTGLLDKIINRVGASILVLCPDGKVLKANATARKMFAASSAGLDGKALSALLTREGANDWQGRRLDGSTFAAEVESSPMQGHGQMLTILTVLDVTRERQNQQYLSSLAYHDPLTGLPNRMLFDDHLKLEIAHAIRRNKRLAVMFVDLDRFKPVNDQYGHHIGDELLQHVARRLKHAVTEGDTVARRGGDEFTLLICDLDTPEQSLKIADRIQTMLSQPYHIAGHQLDIGASIGISLFPDHAANSDDLLDRADQAMYQAKHQGRACCHLFSELA